MGSPAGASGTGTGANANVYNPIAQPAADLQFQNLVNPMAGIGLTGINQVAGVGGSPYGNAYTTATGFQPSYLPGSPYANQGQYWANTAGAALPGQILNQGQAGSNMLFDQGMGGLQWANLPLQFAFSPQVDTAANTLTSAGNQIINTGFDPQQALFNQQQQQLMQQANVANAMSGLAGTPYGASTTANALGNFDINWQNQQLARQAQAGQVGGGLVQGGAMLPINAAGAGANAYSTMLGAGGQGLANANQLALGSGLGATQMGMLPYTTNAQIANQALSGLGTTAGFGQSAFQLPQQIINDLESYMGLGQSASQLSGQLGQMGMNQLAGGIGGGLAGLNSLLGGSSGIFGSGGIGGMFGGGSSAGGMTDFNSLLNGAFGFDPGTLGAFDASLLPLGL